MTKTCIICGGDESGDEVLLEAPCQRHWVCTDDVSSFFERATESESLYPPKCCGQIFLLNAYEVHVPFEVQWAFQLKEQGEYSVLAKYRIYCADPSCSKFLDPSTHVNVPSTDVSYAVCTDDTCGKLTCTTCKTLLNRVDGHTCEQNEDYEKFKRIATEKGFQECPTCASTVELAEACNHITCECGADFCYVCGKSWPGMHGCPHYGPAFYDEEDYNQDGYHRITDLNRENRTRREQARFENNAEDDDEGNDEAEDDPDDHHFVLQHVDAAMRATFAALPRQDREAFMLNLQIQLFEDRGITFALLDERDDDDSEDGSVDDNHFDGDNVSPDSEGDDDGRDDEENQDREHEEQENAGQINVAEEVVQIGDAESRRADELARMGDFVDGFAQEVDALAAEAMQSLEHSEGDGFPSPANPLVTPDEDDLGGLMDVDSVNSERKQERESRMGTPGSWPNDQDL